jgi:hypothetical protein
MNLQAKKPEDMIADSENYLRHNGKAVRKGTMAAIIANIELLESGQANQAEKAKALKILKELAPAVNASGLTKHFHCHNIKVQAIFDSENTRL